MRIKKENLYHLLFTLCVALPYINFYEATFAVWSLTILLTLQKRFSLTFIHYLSYFVAILAIATVVSLFRDNLESYNVIRDITYLLKPILGLVVGYQLCKYHIKDPLTIVVNTAALIAVAHLMVVAYAFVFFHITNIAGLREYGGYFSDFEIYAFVILLFHKKFELPMTTQRVYFFLALIGLSSLLYLARTNFIQFIILALAMKGYFALKRSSVIVFGALIAFALISYSIIYSMNPQRGSQGIEAFFYKIKIAPFEPFKTNVNRADWVDFNDNYRSYENIITIQQVSRQGTAAVIFGEGLGSSIDLKQEVWLQTSMMRYIPFLHNGFMTVFLKSGLLGVFIYLYTLFFFFRQNRSQIPLVRNLNLIFLGTGIFLFISNWVFLGFYNLFDTKTILIGFLLAYKERLNKSVST